MSAGLDSVGATELSTRLNERLETELPSTLLFDHPSLRSIAGSFEIDGGDSSA
jgi:acyl carrier protein